MNIHRIKEIIAHQKNLNRRYSEFIRIPEVSVCLYRLPVGAMDLQQPHSEDELYYIIEGQGYLQVGEENQRVEPGTLVHVPPLVSHRFHSITKDLVVLVIFAPSEGTHGGDHLEKKENKPEVSNE